MKETIMNAEEQQNEGTMEISNFLNNNQQIEILNKIDIRNEKFRRTIINFANFMRDKFENHRINDDPELIAFVNKLDSLIHTAIRNLTPLICDWMKKRRELIEIMNSTADELDNNFLWATFGRLFGSSMDLLYNIDSICDYNISGFLTEQAFAISNLLGFCTELFCSSVPHLTYVGLLSSFGDILRYQLIVRKMLKVLKEDISLFDEIQEFLAQFCVQDKNIETICPFTINSDFVKDIQYHFTDCDSYVKIFTLSYISTVGRNPAFLSDLSKRSRFLCAIYLFSKSNVATEWFDRCLQIDHALARDARRFEFRNELMEYFKWASDSETTLEIGGQVVKMKNVPHFIQASINCISIYCASNELILGVKHKNSDILRDLASKAKKILEIMIAFEAKIKIFDMTNFTTIM